VNERRSWPAELVDTHVHSSPDVVPRRLSDLELAREATDAGHRALVLKSHHSITATRATLVNEALGGGTEVLGGVVLNLHATGGINPYAVATALELGARVVWMPTFTAANHVRSLEEDPRSEALRALGEIEGPGLAVLDDEGRLEPQVTEVLDLLADGGATLATGHLGRDEIMRVVPEARRRGVERVIITHPELPCVSLPIADQVELAELGGVWFERVAFVARQSERELAAIAEATRTVGTESTILATDLGQEHNPSPVTGMHSYVEAMRRAGFTQHEVEQMACLSPAAALGLD
jgi:imidazolonepropionase-like amidohydrolase